MIRVLLVDDDPLVRAGLRLMLAGAGDIEVVGEAADGAEVRSAVAAAQPDVVLMDVRMPVLDGVDATRAITRGESAPAVVVLTTFDVGETVVAALRAGAAGFLLKHTPPADIVAAVRAAAVGEPVLSPSVARRLIAIAASTAPDPDPAAGARARLAVLTDREREVAAVVADGLSNAEIGARLHLSPSSIKATISSALAKLDLDNRIQLAILAHEAGREPGGTTTGRRPGA